MKAWIDRNFNSRREPIMGVERLRINSDGDGVTTLVGFYGCPLKCRYCLNPQCHGYKNRWMMIPAKQLYREIKLDEIYMRMTGGGITFGGGEPCNRVRYIKEFRTLCGKDLKINVETCLNVRQENIEDLIPIVDYWIVDIKDLNPDIYLSYTQRPINQLLNNLTLLKQEGIQDRTLIRVPLIPGFNTIEDQKKSIDKLRTMGFEKIESFNYILPSNEQK